ncbi:MAG: 16S rRNA (cytosine(1402)-N(4))-methyltransferase RsmH [Deltaproteobacteria bacterium]|nr:16S rRNA (cytosine(1402)-N(4))-methyltransferase RsmH [Deltaproteobacteria bacterium]
MPALEHETSSAVTHAAVMLRETVELLRPRSGGRYVDGTLGGGGHAQAILEASGPHGELLGIDWDEEARARAAARLARFGARVHIVDAVFDQIGECLERFGWEAVDGILLDLGVSSFHLDLADRGFSFARSGPLDMRMSRSRARALSQWLDEVSEPELVRVLREYGEEPQARRIARAILAARRRGELADTAALAALVSRIAGRSAARHPATRTFQALRIAVNGELEILERFLADAYRWLRPGGRLVVLAYHSLEDRLVKSAFRLWERSCVCSRGIPVCRCGWAAKVTLLTRRAIRPSGSEVAENPRARSARLRAVERLAA